MLRRHSASLAVLLASTLFIPFATRNASAADVERGAALYELRCGNCHTESVHGRSKRVATDFGEVRGWVNRWNENLGLRWGNEEIEDVSVYLNKTYYHYTCPPQVCKAVSLAPRSATPYSLGSTAEMSMLSSSR
jgi:mono/diheme cytochrome c family protein